MNGLQMESTVMDKFEQDNIHIVQKNSKYEQRRAQKTKTWYLSHQE